MKQSYRYILLILGILFTVFGFLLFSYDNPLKPINLGVIVLMFLGMFMLYKILHTTNRIKVNEVKVVDSILDIDKKKNRYKKENEVTLNDQYKKKDL